MVELVNLFFLALAGTGRLLRLLDGMVVAFGNRVGGGDVIFEKDGGTGVAGSAGAVVERGSSEALMAVLSCFTAMRPLPAAAAADGNIRSQVATHSSFISHCVFGVGECNEVLCLAVGQRRVKNQVNSS